MNEERPDERNLVHDNPLLAESESDKSDQFHWSKDVETQLQNIEENSRQQAEISKKQYLELMYLAKFFKIPVIVISGVNSVFSIGLSSYVDQSVVSILNCILAFICSVIGSIELYLNITKKIEISLTSYQSFYLLSVKINNCLRLERHHRDECDGRKFLAECLNHYENLFQANNVSIDKITDNLTGLELNIHK